MKELTILINPKQIKDSPHQALLINLKVDDDQNIECTDGEHDLGLDVSVLASLEYKIVGVKDIEGE